MQLACKNVFIKVLVLYLQSSWSLLILHNVHVTSVFNMEVIYRFETELQQS